MKSNMTQILTISIAILFAMALSLTVALICLSYAGGSTQTQGADDEKRDPNPITLPQGNTTEIPTTTAPPIVLPSPEELGNGLAFTSNGDGTCTLTGLGKCTDACIVIPSTSPAGDLVVAVAPRALYGCAATAIQLPSTVTSIGALAFADCPNLIHISVDIRNAYYCDIDGVLYTSDGYSLLTYPAMHAGKSITLSSVTAEISDMAFYNCAYLTHVYYTGSAEQWESIVIGSKNYSLTAASKTFYGGN